MTAPPLVDHRSDTRHLCWPSPGSADTRLAPLECPAILPSNSQNAHSPLHAHARFEPKTAPRSLRRNLLKPDPAAKSP
jgi:hypothetical protein